MRALYEICLRRKWGSMALTCLELCKSVERRLWRDAHPLRQFESVLAPEVAACRVFVLI